MKSGDDEIPPPWERNEGDPGPRPEDFGPPVESPEPVGDDAESDICREAFPPQPDPAANAANPLTGPEPVPLFRALPAGEPYPVDALGRGLAGAVRAIVDMVQCHPATAAGSVLGAASLAVQGLADVVLPFGEGQTRPASLFLLTVAASGERKTTADRMALGPVSDFEAELAERHRAEWPDYVAGLEAYKHAKAKAIGKGGQDWKASREAVRALGAEPQPPLAPVLTASEPTMQGLAKLFQTARPSLGLMNDEGGAMLGGWGFQAENRTGTMAALNSLWDGSALKRVRAGDGPEALHGRRLACHLMLQPNVAATLLGDPEAAGIGLLARFLLAAPAELAGTRMQRPHKPNSPRDLKTYAEQLAGLLRLPLPTKDGDPRHLMPRKLALSPEAKGLWSAYADRCEVRGGPGGEWCDIRPWASKAAEHAARLAAVIALFHDPETRELDAAAWERGERLADFYGGEMLRLSGGAAIGADLMEADALWQWIRAKGLRLVASSRVVQFGPNPLRTAAKARAALGKLEENGWLERVPNGATVNGKRYRDVWQVAAGALA